MFEKNMFLTIFGQGEKSFERNFFVEITKKVQNDFTRWK